MAGFIHPRRVIIYSHGNAVDIGCCIDSMKILGSALDTDYIFYDYEGYGCSGGEAHSKNLSRDLRTVYEYALTLFDGKDIYLLGESSIKQLQMINKQLEVYPLVMLQGTYIENMNKSQDGEKPLSSLQQG